MIEKTADKELNGLVLVGGKSRRMGRAKAFLDFGDGPQWQVCENVLRSVCTKVHFSVSPNLKEALPLAPDRMIADILAAPIGPLGGILSAFKRQLESAQFVLACDLPNFDHQAATYLNARRNQTKKATAFVLNDEVEPLCAIYEPSIMEDVAVSFIKGIYCPKKILSSLDIERIEPLDEKWLKNVNHDYEFKEMVKEGDRKSVKVYFYASLREEAQRSYETVTTSSLTIGQLFNELKDKYGFSINEDALRFAKNDQLVCKSDHLEQDDTIVFIPPVSGG